MNEIPFMTMNIRKLIDTVEKVPDDAEIYSIAITLPCILTMKMIRTMMTLSLMCGKEGARL